MTKLGNENLCAVTETTKRRAHAIKARLGAMGYNASLSHAYEVLATASGYRNWPTMKAASVKVADGGSAAKNDMAQRPPSAVVLGSTNSKVLLRPELELAYPAYTSARERLEKASAGDLTTWIVRKIDDEGSWAAQWKGRVTALLYGIMQALVYLRDHKGDDLDIKAIRDCLPLDRYLKFARGVMLLDAPENIRRPISVYFNAADYVDADARDQSEAVVEAHGYLEALISDALCMIETELRWHAFRVKRRGERPG
ncbi:hypothetical protein O9X98_08880 [Agrobacterium salinitolerans]|nr:hypothetical protein [Agrobacterium salinitolerans]